LAGLVLHAHGALSLDALRSIGLEMVVAFIAGQLLQPWIGSWVQARRRALAVVVDRGSVLLVVYTVFSGAALSGIWHQLAFEPLMALFAAAGSLLALMLAITALAGRGLGFSREDQNRDHIRRLEKEPRRRDPNGEFAVCRPRLGPHRPAVDGVLSDPGHGPRRARPALCEPLSLAVKVGRVRRAAPLAL
jgi:hypothetical protein